MTSPFALRLNTNWTAAEPNWTMGIGLLNVTFTCFWYAYNFLFYRAKHSVAWYCQAKLSVRPFVCLKRWGIYRGHIGWNSWKIILQLISLTFPLCADLNTTGQDYRIGTTPLVTSVLLIQWIQMLFGLFRYGSLSHHRSTPKGTLQILVGIGVW